jgi:two-component system catabolic regulation response regulator CreB
MAEMPRVLVVEDEPAIADTLLYALKTEGFSPFHCATGGEALAALREEKFVLVILDVGLPDGSGFDFCKAIRGYSTVPVLFLTARNTELDRVLGLELGGDDYVTKPFSPREITARVKAILRRAKPDLTAKDSAPATGITIDEESCSARCAGMALELTRYEFRLLKALANRPGRVYSRDELMTAAWEDPGASLDRTVDAHIKTLRAKLRAAAPDSDAIAGVIA